jgi:O-antigen/teichoic acid export membrane protein
MYGLIGAAMAYALHGAMDLTVTYVLARRVSKFRWSWPVLRLGGILFCVQMAALLASLLLSRWTMLLCGGIMTFLVSLMCLKEALHRLGPGHRVSRMFSGLPLLGRLVTAGVPS